MRKQPAWDFASLSKNEYLTLSNDEKSSLINRYFTYMLSSEKNTGGKFTTSLQI